VTKECRRLGLGRETVAKGIGRLLKRQAIFLNRLPGDGLDGMLLDVARVSPKPQKKSNRKYNPRVSAEPAVVRRGVHGTTACLQSALVLELA